MIKKILRNWHRYVLWALISVMLWAWILLLATKAPKSQMIQIFADLSDMKADALEIALEREKPQGVKYVQASLIDNLIVNTSEILEGDLYLVPESRVENYLASFSPIDRTMFPGASFYESDGVAYGLLVYDDEADFAVGWKLVRYIPGQRCWLFFNKDSVHLGDWNGSPDDAAITIARNFLQLTQGE